MRKAIALLAVLLAAHVLPARPAEGSGIPVDLELVLAVDVSGSIDEEEGQLQRQGYIAALLDPRLHAAIQGGTLGRIALSYVEWAGEHYQRTVVPWRLIEGPEGAAAFAGLIERAPRVTENWTSISAALDYATTLIETSGFESTRKIIDISGDGKNNSGRSVVLARNRALAAGIVINALPIISDKPSPWGWPPPVDLDRYFEEFVIGGPGAFMVVARDFGAFGQAILAKMLREIAGLDETPEPARYALAALPAPPATGHWAE
ncbi:MAG: DUF1194 domain-containing protein [Thalassobaculales bacterium]